MAHSFQQHTSNESNKRNGYNNNFDAPLIGDLKLDTNNNNNANTITNPMIYNDDQHVHDINSSLHTDQFYEYVIMYLISLHFYN